MTGDKPNPVAEAELARLGEEHRRLRHYFVDEAGDPVLFNSRKQIVVGQEGCSRFFMLGALDVPDPEGLGRELVALRLRMLADPYFQGVPSFDPARGKTAVAFHAKDDLPEVRREVFQLLLAHPVKFYAVVRDKHEVVGEVRRRNARDTSYRYNQNELYDRLVEKLFQDRLHKGSEFRVSFAERGSSDRTAALKCALEAARRRFQKKWQRESNAPIVVEATSPRISPCLQAADYFLWALQRRFERAESRFLDLLWSKVGLVIHADSKEAGYGTYYTRDRPIPQPQVPAAAQEKKRPADIG